MFQKMHSFISNQSRYDNTNVLIKMNYDLEYGKKCNVLCHWFQEYENEAERFKAVLDLDDGLVPQTYKRTRLESPAMKVNREVIVVHKLFF